MMDGSFKSLFQPFRLFASGGPTFGRPKVGGKTAGETPGPLFLPNRSVSGEMPGLPPNFQLSFVIGAVHIRLRLTALGLRGVSFWGGRGSQSASHSSRQLVIESQIRLSLQKAVRRSRTSSPPQIRCQRKVFQWQRSINSDTDRLGQKRGSSPKGAGAFSVHFCAYKSEPGVWGRGGPNSKPRGAGVRSPC